MYAAMIGEIASTATRVTRIIDCMNANVRPRTSSCTSSPSIVKPVTQQTPEKAPKIITINTANVKFGIAASKTKKDPATVKEAPNSRRRENCANILGPNAIPIARPVNTEPKSTP